MMNEHLAATPTKHALIFVICLFFFGTLGMASAGVADVLGGLLRPEVDHGPSFSTSALYPVDLRLSSAPGLLSAFGDFNSDRYNDLFMLSADRRSVSVLLWDHEDYAFRKAAAATIEYTNGTVISNVAGADFNYDGRLDLLVSGTLINGSRFLHIHFGDYSSFPSRMELPPAAGEVLVLDANGDLLPDLFGTIASSGARGFWINRHNAHSFDIELQGDGGAIPLGRLVGHTGASFADMDGDCRADLVVLALNASDSIFVLEVWLNGPSGFMLDKRLSLPAGVAHYTLNDLDGDGTLDILVAVRAGGNAPDRLLVGHNRQMPLCAHPWDTGCRQATHLCTPDPHYLRNISFAAGTLSQVSVIELAERRFHMHGGDLPFSIHVGDYNLDGYPDLLLPLVHDKEPRVELWENVRCEGSHCPEHGRSFRAVTEGTSSLAGIANAHSAAFFDFDENGSLDILVLVDDGTPIGQHALGVFNNFQVDAFFLKTLGLNGVCVSWCSTGPKFPHPKPYGVSQAGGVFKFTVTDLSGMKRVSSGTQLSQSGRLSLQTPYHVFGLGRTSNYIEDFAYAVPIRGPAYYNYWICIIPNSQLVAIPHEPTRPDTWQLELYINPSGMTLWVILAVASCLVMLALVIGLLDWREKKQDEQLKKENEKIFSFSPL